MEGENNSELYGSNAELFTFDSALNQSSYIKVIGVGGGGGNAVNHMFRKGIQGVDFIVCNTDTKALQSSPVPNKLVLGTVGLGAGGRPSKARKAAEMKEKEIKDIFSQDTRMVFITAGMGGGTGTGAAPVIARLAKEIKLEVEDDEDTGKILVVAVVTTPFLFEGNRRLEQAEEGIAELRKYVDSILVINNEKLRGFGDLVLSDAFAMANDVLFTAVKGIAEIITLKAYVNIDFRDVNTVMESSGTALMGIGTGEGDNRANAAIVEASNSVLLDDNDIAGAKNVLLYLAYGPEREITMDEVTEVTTYITQKTGGRNTNVIWGAGNDEELGEKLKITLIATGFECKERITDFSEIHETDPNDYDFPRTPSSNPHDESKQPTNNPVEQPSKGNMGDTASLGGADQTRTYPDPQQDPYIKFQPKPTEQHPAQQQTERKGNVFILDDQEQVKQEQPRTITEDETMPHIISRPAQQEQPQVTHNPIQEPKPIQAPRAIESVTIPTPIRPQAPTMEDLEAMDKADKIKFIHDQLRNDINGGQAIENLDAALLTGGRAASLASAADQYGSSVNAKGVIDKMYNQLPD